jgi:threonine dehydratase
MPLLTLAEIEAAEQLVRRYMPATPQYCWPLLSRRIGCEVWVKHENHTPTGAFKIRGGIVYLNLLRAERPDLQGVVTATRGNHGQSVALAATRLGMRAAIVVPEGNSPEKNLAMQAFGAELIVEGRDFDEARATAMHIASEKNLHIVPPFHPNLVKGVATYALEFFRSVSNLDAVYVPIGMGSGICGMITVRDLLGMKAEIIGVAAAGAPAIAQSFAAKRIMNSGLADTFADGLACRNPDPQAFDIIRKGASRVVCVDDDEIAAAIRAIYADTHNVAEGAAAAPLAAMMREREAMKGKCVGLVLSGSNIDSDKLADILAGKRNKTKNENPVPSQSERKRL